MSHVQIRQVPVATSTDAQRIVGSWFPSGYYGHFRAKSRADLCQYFRQLARPEPPKKFFDRQQAEAVTHMFSQHDNRFKFECDPLVRGTQSGFGKQKSKTNSRGEFDPLFVSWVPKNVDRKDFVEEPKISAYAEEYNHDTTSSHKLANVQLKPPLSSGSSRAGTPSEPDVSVYSLVYQHGQPDQQQSKQIRRETQQRYLTARARLLQTKRNDRSASVASCLVWNNIDVDKATEKPALPNESMIRITVPMTLQPRAVSNNGSPRQRAQSAGARLVSTTSVPSMSQAPPPPPPPAPSLPAPVKPFQSSSMQMLKSPISTMERPHTATTTSREHFTGGNFGLVREPPPRAATSFEPKHTNSMESLISKYM